ncbi:hypothetical protein [Clostridium sp. DL1XJH146]
MLISKTKKGITAIEIMVCIALSVIVLGYLNRTIFALNIAKANIIKKENYLEVMEVVYENLKVNIEYEEYQDMRKDNRVFINNNNLCIDELDNKDIKSVFQNKVPVYYPYLDVKIEEYEEGVLLVILSFVDKDKKTYMGSFYKGDYLCI